jgi:hypothetical protein
MHYLSLKEAVTLKNGDLGSFKLTSFKDYLDSFDEEMRRKVKFFIPEASFHIDVNFSEGNEKESIFSERILSPNSRGLSLCIFHALRLFYPDQLLDDSVRKSVMGREL